MNLTKRLIFFNDGNYKFFSNKRQYRYVLCEGQNNNLTYYKKINTNWNHYESGTVLVTSLINE